MKITPIDIQQQKFKIKFRGFDVREVDTFLEQLADSYETFLAENKNLLEDIQRLKLELQGYKNREETFKRAMLNSEKVLEQMKQNAQKSSELIIADAEVKAEKILSRAQNRLAQLHEDITELKRQRMQIEVQIRAIIESHSKLLEIGLEESKAREIEDDKLKILTQSE